MTVHAGRSAIVVGGSVAGLFVANLLTRRGWRVTVYERVAEGLQSRGAGIANHAELEAVLTQAGARSDIPRGIRVAGRTAYGADGRQIAYLAYDQFLAAWSDVLKALLAVFPGERYRLGLEVVGVELRDQGRVGVRLADGRMDEGDLVIGADGFRSTVRSLFAPQVAPRYAGYVAWRGMVEEGALSERFRGEAFGRFAFVFPPGSQFIGYPVAGPGESLQAGRRRYAFLWYFPVDHGDALADLLTDDGGRRHETSIPPPLIRREHLDRFRSHAAALLPADFADTALRSRALMLQPIYDIESERMAFGGRVALIGDAAFVARPHVGVGVLKGAQDALELAEALDACATVEAALARFEARRSAEGRATVRLGQRLGAFIERRLAAPWSDPSLGLTPTRVLELSGRPLQHAPGDMACA